MIFFDTEGLGTTGPLLTIQYAQDDDDPKIHYIWKEPIEKTLRLLEWMTTDTVCAWNLVYDWFHLVKWYNIFRECTWNQNISEPPDPYKTWETERQLIDNRCLPCYALKPPDALDLMIAAGRDQFQHLKRQKPIMVRLVPELLVYKLKEYLEKYLEEHLPLGTTFRFLITDDTRREGLVNLKILLNERSRLSGLKLKYVHTLVKHGRDYKRHLGDVKLASDLFRFDQVFGTEYAPWGGNWVHTVQRASDFNYHQARYAYNDVIMLRDIYEYLGKPQTCRDSRLSVMAGITRWRGFAISFTKLEEKFPKKSLAPHYWADVLKYMHEVMNPIERLVFVDTESKKTTTKKPILKAIAKEGGHFEGTEAQKRANAVLMERKNKITRALLGYLRKAGAFHPTVRIDGTFTNRMAGGSGDVSAASKWGRINPQGIDKGLRDVFPCADDNECLGVGDFSGFEVTIAVAVWGSKALEDQIRAGRSIHGLFGAEIYDISYDEILASRQFKGTLKDKYQMAKNTFFARTYGAMIKKCAETLNLTEPEVVAGLKRWERKYQLDEHRQAIERRYTMLDRWEWQEPDTEIVSILGFRRSFAIEIAVAKALWEMDIPSEWYNMDRVYRRKDKAQNPGQAMRSAILSTIFTLQGRITRTAANHQIQSPGGDICKAVQDDVWSLQPTGVHPLRVRMLNVHDEIVAVYEPGLPVKETIAASVERLREQVPLLEMEWKENLKHWGEK